MLSRAFTLPELLAVIAILAAILVPVFLHAQDAGIWTTCLSNMRQLGMGCRLCINDCDDAFPYSAWCDASAANVHRAGSPTWVNPCRSNTSGQGSTSLVCDRSEGGRSGPCHMAGPTTGSV